MTNKLTRKIVRIDENLCDGCGACVPNCAEGAIQIIDGKARLVADNLCDGLGNCLGTCPKDAITIEERAAEEFDETAVEQHLHPAGTRGTSSAANGALATGGAGAPPLAPKEDPHFACPGRMLRKLNPAAAHGGPGLRPRGTAPDPAASHGAQGVPAPASQLRHWPVQLHLLPTRGEIWNNADVLIAADCVAFAMPDFHQRLLAGKTVAIGCPKLDDTDFYTQKLTQIFAGNAVRSVTAAHMEVPCCTGIVLAARRALAQAGRGDIEFHDVTVGIDGAVQQET